jgi:dipeptidase D
MPEKVLANLEPQLVWNIFEEITKIPRPSKKEEKIRSWVKKWAIKNKIAVKEDAVGNLLLSKKASPGKEKSPALVLQGHLDMVCQKTPDSKSDCETESLIVQTNNEIVTAEGTSLGADNGIGMALGLAALIDEELEAGPLEVLLTVDEETGMTGALRMKKGFFTGNHLLNIDSEILGEITISSAGGGDTHLTIPVEKHSVKGCKGIRLEISGLRGGHSGIDIDKNRLNAIRVGVDALTRIQDYLKEQENKGAKLLINNIYGGTVLNAIAREFYCDFLVPKANNDMILKVLKHWKRYASSSMKDIEPQIKIEISEMKEEEAFSAEQTMNIVSLLSELHHGVISMSQEIEGLVQTSNNLAVVKTSSEYIIISLSTRSSVDEELNEAREKAKKIGETFGAKVSFAEAYPGWKPNLDSPFLKMVKENYEEVLKKEVELKAIHAGLECGMFLKLNPKLSVSSIGPTIKNVHSIEEYVVVESVKVIWEVVKKIIQSMGDLE